MAEKKNGDFNMAPMMGILFIPIMLTAISSTTPGTMPPPPVVPPVVPPVIPPVIPPDIPPDTPTLENVQITGIDIPDATTLPIWVPRAGGAYSIVVHWKNIGTIETPALFRYRIAETSTSDWVLSTLAPGASGTVTISATIPPWNGTGIWAGPMGATIDVQVGSAVQYNAYDLMPVGNGNGNLSDWLYQRLNPYPGTNYRWVLYLENWNSGLGTPRVGLWRGQQGFVGPDYQQLITGPPMKILVPLYLFTNSWYSEYSLGAVVSDPSTWHQIYPADSALRATPIIGPNGGVALYDGITNTVHDMFTF